MELPKKPLHTIPYPSMLLRDKPENLFLMKAVGMCMHPTIKDDSLVLFRHYKNDDVKDNDIILFSIGDKMLIKRAKVLRYYTMFIPDNLMKFEPIILDDSIRVLGKALNVK